MSESGLISGSDFFRRLTVFFGILSTIAIFLIAGYIYALTRLSSAEWAGFLRILAVAAPVLFIGTTLLNRPLHAPITRYLNAEAEGRGAQPDLRAAFGAICRALRDPITFWCESPTSNRSTCLVRL